MTTRTTFRIDGQRVDEQFTDAYEIESTMDKRDGGW